MESVPDALWVEAFFSRMLDEELSLEEFENVVDQYWCSGQFILKAAATAEMLKDIVAKAGVDAKYANDAPHLGFMSQWLVGVPGKPGAIHINAPPEKKRYGRSLADLNRKLHCHDSGRIALITSGKAVFHVLRKLPDGRAMMLDCPVGPGDLILWPRWMAHTFDACDGFSLVSAMANYVSPAEDGFVFPVPEDDACIEALPRLSPDAFGAA